LEEKMKNLLVDPRDQKFVINEMLGVEELFETPFFGHLSQKTLDMSLDAAAELATRAFYPTIMEADTQGCRLESGAVYVPECYRRLKDHFDQGNWSGLENSLEHGGQQFPRSAWLAVVEGFMPNVSFMWGMNKPFSGTKLIEMFGSEEQKKRYLKKLVPGQWGSIVAVNEDESGCDATMQTAQAIEQPDGSYRIKGIKGHVTYGDSDLFENVIHLVMARIEGAPPDQNSIFIVPKYLPNGDGSLGTKNDIIVSALEEKLGLKGKPTCRVHYGENDACYGEIVGEPGQGMMMALPLILNGYLDCGIMCTGIASAAYRHALDYAQKRKQGASLADGEDPDAPRVPIIQHPDVRRMLLSMKAHVEGMRALLYFTGLCVDKAKTASDPEQIETWSALRDMLMPVCRIYTADAGFRVTETAIQVHGRYGYFKGSPVEQFIRDIKINSIWELTTGIHSLIFVAQTMPQREGQHFAKLLGRMGQTIETYGNVEGIQDLAEDVQEKVQLLGEVGMFFGECAQKGSLIVPVSNATPFMHLMGHVCMGWLLFWQAGIAARKLESILNTNNINPLDAQQKGEFISQNRDAAFYEGKILGARYFIKNILPGADALAKGIKSEDLSLMALPVNGF
jgi:alkylation response protein AidB-like acyl-CoA dehydrogenase